MLPSIRSLVVACGAARLAVEKAILAKADIELRLAKAAEFIAFALQFGLFALTATKFSIAGFVGHRNNVERLNLGGNVPLVTWARFQTGDRRWNEGYMDSKRQL